MRMTAATLYRDSGAAIASTAEQLLEFQRQVASGKRIGKPSDDPSGTATAITERAQLTGIEQFQRTADSVTARLTVIDGALSDMVEKLSAAQSAVLSARGTVKTAAQREAAAQSLEGIRDALLEGLNTSFQGVYVFGGADSTSPPYTKTTPTTVSGYQGSTREVAVDIDNGRSVVTGLDGSRLALGGATTDVFTVLTNVIAAARTSDEQGLATGLTELQDAFNRVTTAQSRIGGDLAAVSTQQGQLTTRRLAATARVSSVEDANMATAITGMTQADAAYRAALSATGRLTQTSLMDYLS